MNRVVHKTAPSSLCKRQRSGIVAVATNLNKKRRATSAWLVFFADQLAKFQAEHGTPLAVGSDAHKAFLRAKGLQWRQQMTAAARRPYEVKARAQGAARRDLSRTALGDEVQDAALGVLSIRQRGRCQQSRRNS